MDKVIKFIDYDDMPDSWNDRCSGNGWKTKIDDNGNRLYDDGISKELGVRPCKRCGEFPTQEGHDSCLGEIKGEVLNACCGHGQGEGYLQFDNVMLRGLFRAVDIKKESEMTADERIIEDIKTYQEYINICNNKIKSYSNKDIDLEVLQDRVYELIGDKYDVDKVKNYEVTLWRKDDDKTMALLSIYKDEITFYQVCDIPFEDMLIFQEISNMLIDID